jgi:threonine synthase
MHEKSAMCSGCGKEHGIDGGAFRCGCGGSLEIVFDYRKISRSFVNGMRRRPFNHARYLELYPVRKLVSIQEGGTPLIRSSNLERILGLGFELYFKYEAQNPTGSFKDRGSSVEIGRALELGIKKAVCASTGNMGASLAAYSGIANIRCFVLTPSDARIVKIEQMLACGADVYRVCGDYAMAAKMAERACTEHGVYLLGDYMYRREGTKSVGFEICEQLSNPDYIITPIGNGTLISATWKAMKEFETLKMLKKKPRMIGVQSSRCMPVVRAFMESSEIRPVTNPHTVAVAIECGDPIDGGRALNAIRESSGFAESVTDREILKARELLSRKEGLFAEPAGAVSLAGLIKNKDRIEKGSRVVCLVTGHGLKAPMTGVKGTVKKLGSGPSSLPGAFK